VRNTIEALKQGRTALKQPVAGPVTATVPLYRCTRFRAF
jgi:hypothetical protein